MSRRRHAAVVAVGAVVSWWVASPGLSRLDDHVVGDDGDAMWQLSVMRWTLDALGSLRLPWTPPMYFPTTGTYAYSDPMVTQALVAAPLRAVGASPALVSNAVLLLAGTAAVYFAWRLLRRVGGSDVVALAGAVAWSFSELRIATVLLFQIVTAAALVPLLFERLFVTLDRPTPLRGLVLGGVASAGVLAALYYGPLFAVTVPVAAVVWFVVARQRPTGGHVVAAGVALVVVVVTVLPIAIRYQDVHRRDDLGRAPEAAFSATWSDAGSVASDRGVLAGLPVLARAGSGERALFPGLFVVAAVPAGLLLLLRRRSPTSARRGPPAELTALVAAGLAAYALASGTPLRVLDGLPGFDGIRAPVRFAVLGHLGLVAAATWLVAAAVARVRTRLVVALALAVLVGVALVDVSSRVPTAAVPDRRRWSAVNERLDELPPGPVVELPIMQSSDGVAWPRVEAPRLYLAAIDGNRRVNGYSGFQPPGFASVADELNEFPAPPAVAALRRLGVRYVILRADVVGRRTRARRAMLAIYGTDDEARLVATPPPTLPAGIRDLGRHGSAVLLEVES